MVTTEQLRRMEAMAAAARAMADLAAAGEARGAVTMADVQRLSLADPELAGLLATAQQKCTELAAIEDALVATGALNDRVRLVAIVDGTIKLLTPRQRRGIARLRRRR